MRIDLDTCRDPDLLAAEVRRLRAVIAAGEPAITDDERDAIYDGLYCLNIFCNARQSGDVLAVKLRGAAETLRSLLHSLEGER